MSDIKTAYVREIKKSGVAPFEYCQERIKEYILSERKRELLVNLNEGRGRLKLAYDISVKGLFNHFNTISIELREDPDFYGNQGKAETNH